MDDCPLQQALRTAMWPSAADMTPLGPRIHFFWRSMQESQEVLRTSKDDRILAAHRELLIFFRVRHADLSETLRLRTAALA